MPTPPAATGRRGTLHAVRGENGAGNTTLVRIAFGLVRPDAGELRVDGTARRFETSRERYLPWPMGSSWCTREPFAVPPPTASSSDV